MQPHMDPDCSEQPHIDPDCSEQPHIDPDCSERLHQFSRHGSTLSVAKLWVLI